MSEEKRRWYNESGQLHREDGPALITDAGDEYWYFRGDLHRKDGPAVVCSNGKVEWRLSGWGYSFDHYCRIVGLSEEDKMVLKLKYGIEL